MALGSTLKRSVREQLELQFDTYLAQVVSYLKEGYRELDLSPELIEEIAATVIVRVSHSNPEPERLEQALFASADDVVRARRPRLSQQKLMEGAHPPLRSEVPASLPSLRLIQRLNRASPSNTDDVDPDGLAIGRLSLPNPPVDLQASLNTMDFNGAKELEGVSIPSAARSELEAAPMPSAEIPSLQHEPRFQPVIPSYDDSIDELTNLRDKSRVNEPGALERELDEQLSTTALQAKPEVAPNEEDDPTDVAPLGMRQPSIVALNEAAHASSLAPFVLGGASNAPHSPPDATLTSVHPEPAVVAPPVGTSSAPPTKESVSPKALAELPALFGQGAGAESVAAQSASDFAPPPTPKSRTGGERAQGRRPNKSKTAAAKKHVAVASQPTIQSYGILPDELATLSMVGFPDNPRRAARLCVAALADEVGLSSSDGFPGPVDAVTQALEVLQRGFAATGNVGAHAALQWQRVARQATLRALLNR